MLTSPDELPTPDINGSYNMVADLQTLATATQNTFIKRANSYIGTASQRTAFTIEAPAGTLWSDTDGDQLLWVKNSIGWGTANPGVTFSGAVSANPANFTVSANTRVLKQGNLLVVNLIGTALNAMGDTSYDLCTLNLGLLGVSSILTPTAFLASSDGGNNVYMGRVDPTGVVSCVDSTLGRSGGNAANDAFEASFSLITV